MSRDDGGRPSDPPAEPPAGPTTDATAIPVLVNAELPLPTVSEADVPALLESLLLVAPGATPVADLARSTSLTEDAVEKGLAALTGRYGAHSGLLLQRHGETVQLTSAPRFAVHVRRFLRLDRETRLSAAALETLAIVAYQQPVTRSEIDAVRGVDSSGVLATLHGRGLVEQVGRLQTPGNPVQYGTTAAFLRHFGLQSVGDLPPLGQLEGRDARAALAAAATVPDAGDAPDPPPAGSADPPRRGQPEQVDTSPQEGEGDDDTAIDLEGAPGPPPGVRPG